MSRAAQTAAERDADANRSKDVGDGAGQIPREFRERMKRARGAKGMLMDLEEEVRRFVGMWEEKRVELASQAAPSTPTTAEKSEKKKERGGKEIGKKAHSKKVSNDTIPSSDEEDIVFVGRNGAMRDVPASPVASRVRSFSSASESSASTVVSDTSPADELARDKLILASLVSDHGAAFGRYLVHTIAAYYDLESYALTTDGEPRMREAYVSLKDEPLVPQPTKMVEGLPRPLWGIV